MSFEEDTCSNNSMIALRVIPINWKNMSGMPCKQYSPILIRETYKPIFFKRKDIFSRRTLPVVRGTAEKIPGDKYGLL